MAKILVVDDREDNRAVLERMLAFAGHTTSLAANGREALQQAEIEIPDLVLMDLAMPGMDGWEATTQMKQRPDLQEVPVIVVTGFVTQDAVTRAQEAGCADVISKPIDYYVLIEKLERHLYL